ncbi:hypothetical protein F4808DRAFT_150803 [Astrocystis sublimbata]|nr:hypothetical protein F4808DRAFT_150803 [Astrocystis sublimbata]
MSVLLKLNHVPALIVATTMTFGGLYSLLNPHGTLSEFGFPPRIAETPAAASPFKVGNVRTTVIGLLTYIFYFRNQLEVVDTILAVTGAYCGLVDSLLVWKEGNKQKAVFRLVSSGFLAACGFLGATAGR